jgi:hypothetical protein
MNEYLIFSLVIVFVGIDLLAGGLFLLVRQRARLARSLRAEGEVVELLKQVSPSDYVTERTIFGVRLRQKVRYRVVVHFRTQAGQVVKFSPAMAKRPSPFQVGERVGVFYDPADPQQAQIDQFVFLWLNVALILFFGVFALLMGLLGVMLQAGG